PGERAVTTSTKQKIEREDYGIIQRSNVKNIWRCHNSRDVRCNSGRRCRRGPRRTGRKKSRKVGLETFHRRFDEASRHGQQSQCAQKTCRGTALYRRSERFRFHEHLASQGSAEEAVREWWESSTGTAHVKESGRREERLSVIEGRAGNRCTIPCHGSQGPTAAARLQNGRHSADRE